MRIGEFLPSTVQIVKGGLELSFKATAVFVAIVTMGAAARAAAYSLKVGCGKNPTLCWDLDSHSFQDLCAIKAERFGFGIEEAMISGIGFTAAWTLWKFGSCFKDTVVHNKVSLRS